eukprot:Opistho-1_new@101283
MSSAAIGSNRIDQMHCTLRQAGCGSRVLFNQGRILLCQLIELVDGGVDLANSRGLFLRGSADLIDQCRHAVDAVDQVVHRLTRMIDQPRAALNALNTGTDECLDFSGGCCAAL